MAEDRLEDTTFDAIIIGTSTVQSLLAGTLAVVGKKILHVDSNQFYGSEYTTWTLEGLTSFLEQNQNPKPVTTEETKDESNRPCTVSVNVHKIAGNTLWASQSQLRSFNIDMIPKELWCTGDLVDVLVATNVTRYLEFHTIQQSFLYLDSKFEPVPCSKGDIFKSKFLGLSEKRKLMKFITLCSDPNNEALLSQMDKPFSEFIMNQDLSPNLRSFILYSITLAFETPDRMTITTMEGLKRLQTYMKSVGRYGGSTPFLYPSYGTSEISQSYCRLCAVHAGTYLLRVTAEELLVDADNKVKGIVSTNGQQLSAPVVIADKASALSLLAKLHPSSKYAQENKPQFGFCRAVCIAKAKLVQSNEENTLVVIPPQTAGINNKDAIHILQLSSMSQVAPRGYYLIHLTTKMGDGAEAALQCAINVLFKEPPTPVTEPEGDSEPAGEESQKQEQPAPTDTKPQVLWYTIFSQKLHSPEVLNDEAFPLPSNFYCFTETCSSLAGFEEELNDVKRIFAAIVPDEDFPPRVEETNYEYGNDEEEEEEKVQPVQPTASSTVVESTEEVTDAAANALEADSSEQAAPATTQEHEKNQTDAE
eukprot:TRINITY_DN366_c0_g1_i1.p1 TRINITY_DN366_c0_g1~~TRINITY_DN366_c0_g1_i1.p1  ORF type:complete len:590 (-),score=150.22 TRINITY_DN366_c0_g1_i1:74-1843(-)